MKIDWLAIQKLKITEKKKELLFPIIESNNLPPLIKIENLSHFYGHGKNKKLIFKDLNFSICDNEVLALLGSNGVGKTTLVKIISGIINATSGNVNFLYEKKIDSERLDVQFQDISFPSSLKVKDILNFIINMSPSKLSDEILAEMLTKFQLKNQLNSYAKNLSGGQQQRLNVMIAMLSKPRVLFLDEFTTGLDIESKLCIKNFIIEFSKKENIVIVIISHDIDIINDMADRIILLSNKGVTINSSKQALIDKFGSLSNFLYKYIN
ncbi:MAG: ATP-binding cassette domain-containing protein [Mycoplasmoidaceae bacterium]